LRQYVQFVLDSENQPKYKNRKVKKYTFSDVQPVLHMEVLIQCVIHVTIQTYCRDYTKRNSKYL